MHFAHPERVGLLGIVVPVPKTFLNKPVMSVRCREDVGSVSPWRSTKLRDLVMDAPNATIAKVWIWHDGGGVFGVPLSNYLGWLLTSWLIFQTFALYLRRSGLPPYPRMSLKLAVTGILFYVGSGLTHIVPWIMGQTGEAVDGRGYNWQVHDIREATVAILLLTMVFTALLAALRLLRQASSTSGPTASMP